ncbi:uncharacterized protein LOC119090065 [Pollicipes pollicipes]|uniref:uncharacterized protein LOC119090065 n=1 Tax=Pollicipes pollicipes TaxID=41117 RepID=UPI001884A13D|nr:uncharacterized protein LOC119090065 [Pollicipes pollicipes]
MEVSSSSSSSSSGSTGQKPHLSVSDRVVWLGPLGTRIGTVRWLGELPHRGITVGIELDYELPRGGTDGWHDGRFLFRARANHGQLVPPGQLVREHEFFGQPAPGDGSVGEPPPPPPPPPLTARELIEDAMARVATEQRVLRECQCHRAG